VLGGLPHGQACARYQGSSCLCAGWCITGGRDSTKIDFLVATWSVSEKRPSAVLVDLEPGEIMASQSENHALRMIARSSPSAHSSSS